MKGKPPTKPPPAPTLQHPAHSAIQDEASNYSKNAPPRPPPPKFTTIAIPESTKILSRPVNQLAAKMESDMVVIASRLRIPTSRYKKNKVDISSQFF